jgi:hypothetical protein
MLIVLINKFILITFYDWLIRKISKLVTLKIKYEIR